MNQAPVQLHSPPPRLPADGGWKKWIGPLGAVGLLLLKFGGKLKFLLPMILKSGGSMLLMIGLYGALWGWKYAVGFVALLLLHECGHLVAARHFGLKVSAPMFVPFMGAFIALKDAPRNAWMEAWVGIGGPLLGSLAAGICHALGMVFEVPLLVALAWTGYWLNLFNLTPVGQLDGGRIATALSPWLWLPGIAIMGWFAWTRPQNLIVWLILLVSLPRVFSLFRPRTDEEQRYFEIEPGRRWTMAALYFGLIAALFVGMHATEVQLQDLRTHRTAAAGSR